MSALAQIAATRKRRRLSRGVPSRAVRRANSARPPKAAQMALIKLFDRKLDQFSREVERVLFPVLDQLAPPEDRQFLVVSRDDGVLPGYVTRRLELLEVALLEIFDEEELIAGIDVVGQRVAQTNFNELRRVVGIAIRDADPGVAAFLDNFRAINVSRIKSLVGQELVEITQLLEASEATGARVEVLRESIQQRFNVTKSKAALLARDQTLSLNAQIARTRQQNLGITQYIWTTSQDERVRPEHAELDGTIQSWAVPPPPGHPGEDYQCRCVAFPVLPELA